MKKNIVILCTLIYILISTPSSNAQWQQILDSNLVVTSLAINKTTIFAGTDTAGIYLSSDNGNTWSAANNGLINRNIFSLATNDSITFAGGSSLYLSHNQGNTWSRVGYGLIDEVFAFSINDTNVFAIALGCFEISYIFQSNIRKNNSYMSILIIENVFTYLQPSIVIAACMMVTEIL